MLILLAYLVGGYLTIFVAVLTHFIVADKQGYDVLKWWQSELSSGVFSNGDTVFDLIWGLFVWPVRLINFLINLPWYYEQYDLKE